jgi:hypothetical protein
MTKHIWPRFKELKRNGNNLLTDVASGPGHSDGAFGGRHAVDVALGPDAHGGRDGLSSLLADFDGPLDLFDVLKVLQREDAAWISLLCEFSHFLFFAKKVSCFQ